MLKIKSFFVIVLFVLSTYSVAYATAKFPVATSNFGESYMYSGDELDWIFTFADQQPFKNYTVVEGDNLYRIALANNIPIESLKRLNHLTSESIYPGDELKITGEDVVEMAINEPESEKQKKTVSASTNTSPPIIKSKAEIEAPQSEESSKEMVVTATAYTAYCHGCSGTTAYGIDLRANPNRKVIAVDPRIIPLGTKVWVEGYGEAIAADTGGAIKEIKSIYLFHPMKMRWHGESKQ